MSHQNSKSYIEKHTNSPELEHLKSEHFDIYQQLMKQFEFDDRICHVWLNKPKPFSQWQSTI